MLRYLLPILALILLLGFAGCLYEPQPSAEDQAFLEACFLACEHSSRSVQEWQTCQDDCFDELDRMKTSP